MLFSAIARNIKKPPSAACRFSLARPANPTLREPAAVRVLAGVRCMWRSLVIESYMITHQYNIIHIWLYLMLYIYICNYIYTLYIYSFTYVFQNTSSYRLVLHYISVLLGTPEGKPNIQDVTQMKQSCRSLNMFDLGIDLVQARNPHFMTDTITILLRMSICFFWSSFSEFIRRFQPSQSLDTFGYSIYLYLIYNYSTVPCPVLYSFKPYDRCYSLYPIQPCRILTIVYPIKPYTLW